MIKLLNRRPKFESPTETCLQSLLDDFQTFTFFHPTLRMNVEIKGEETCAFVPLDSQEINKLINQQKHLFH